MRSPECGRTGNHFIESKSSLIIMNLGERTTYLASEGFKGILFITKKENCASAVRTFYGLLISSIY